MKSLLFGLATIFLSLPVLVFAQGKVYSPLVTLNKGNESQTFEQYISFLYGMSISIAALLAVIKIVIAGAKYMLSDVISNKSEAINDIQGAVLGLLLIISAVIILELINPNLVKNEQGIKFPPLQTKATDIKVQPVAPASGPATPTNPTTSGGATTPTNPTTPATQPNTTTQTSANYGFTGMPGTVTKSQSGNKDIYSYTIVNTSDGPARNTEIKGFLSQCTNKGGSNKYIPTTGRYQSLECSIFRRN